jgi:hypothetical protein
LPSICHFPPPTILPSSLTSCYHLFLGLPLGLVDSKFIYNTLLGILFSSILCTCPNQRNLRLYYMLNQNLVNNKEVTKQRKPTTCRPTHIPKI